MTRPIALVLTRALAGAVLMCAATDSALAATPTTQEAIVQRGYGGVEVLKAETVPVLVPGPDQVLIHVYAAAVNPTDWYMRMNTPGYTSVPTPVIPGGDVAGVIQKVGSGVAELKVGDKVFAVLARTGGPLNGGYSHYVVAELRNVVRKPRAMSYAEAAGLGVASITGIRAVIATKVSKGDRLLITGVAGGVGSAAAQAAKAKGAYVIGTATARHNDYLRSIGVDEVIDYSQGPFEDRVHDVDAVLDTVGADTTDRAIKTLKKGGRFLSTARGDVDALCTAAGVVCIPRSPAHGQDRSVLDEVSTLAESGKLKIKVDKTFPLNQAAEAQKFGEQGHTEGKIVLIVDAAKATSK
jgi:NADPH:quinone reductase-like Zn-dependent oxidoreductase